MKLREYMAAESLTADDMAKRLNISKFAVGKYARGERMPRRDVMDRIYAVTNGAVAAADFYGQHGQKVSTGAAA